MTNATPKTFEIDVTWHETAGPHSFKIPADHRAAAAVRSAVEGLNAFGRMFNVYAYLSDGTRKKLSTGEIAALT